MNSKNGFLESLKNILSFLLLRLFLWIPLAYIVFICGASILYGFKMSDFSAYIGIGVFLCFMLSALLVLRRAYYEKTAEPSNKKSVIKQISEEKSLKQNSRRTADTNTDESDDSESENNDESIKSPVPPKLPRQKLFTSDISGQGKTAKLPDDFSSENERRTNARNTLLKNDNDPTSETESKPLDQPSFTKPIPPRIEPTIDRPRYLRTKRDPSLLLLEYSDRLEIYRKTINGIKYERTEYK